jgi:hypothetical protein
MNMPRGIVPLMLTTIATLALLVSGPGVAEAQQEGSVPEVENIIVNLIGEEPRMYRMPLPLRRPVGFTLQPSAHRSASNIMSPGASWSLAGPVAWA